MATAILSWLSNLSLHSDEGWAVAMLSCMGKPSESSPARLLLMWVSLTVVCPCHMTCPLQLPPATVAASPPPGVESLHLDVNRPLQDSRLALAWPCRLLRLPLGMSAFCSHLTISGQTILQRSLQWVLSCMACSLCQAGHHAARPSLWLFNHPWRS